MFPQKISYVPNDVHTEKWEYSTTGILGITFSRLLKNLTFASEQNKYQLWIVNWGLTAVSPCYFTYVYYWSLTPFS